MNTQALITALNELHYADFRAVVAHAKHLRGLPPDSEPSGLYRVDTIDGRAGVEMDTRIRIMQALLDVDGGERDAASRAAFMGWFTDGSVNHADAQDRCRELNDALVARGHAPMFRVRGE